jgi:hypothetical protein
MSPFPPGPFSTASGACPLAEALAIADSALHQKIVDADDLFAAAAALRGTENRSRG